ncbi:hypothetical protein GPUN_1959 [Glaciecola punicea ACAM 611]|uniref:Uncharacterized protein n=1 Tax=Glaciecola punicea ACAM 611 TaxID=1121923 RepID=H5TCP7_9ALTE|nr:hypothetical protein GPUN_1959 [Glaciecola punicea ACAM 611]
MIHNTYISRLYLYCFESGDQSAHFFCGAAGLLTSLAYFD